MYHLNLDTGMFCGVDKNSWHKADDMKIHLGPDMFIADIAADKDHTVTLYTEKDVLELFTITVKITPKDANKI